MNIDNIWIATSERLPDFDKEIEVTYDDGETIDGSIVYMENRVCMLAGVGGGNCYFGEGFASNGTECDKGLICDPPTHWRYK